MQICLAPIGLEDVLREELGARLVDERERLFIVEDDQPVYWAQNIWFDVQSFSFASISQAAKQLRGIQRNWHLHTVSHHRRAQLIQEQLPVLKGRQLPFPTTIPSAPMGSWTLFDEGTMMYAAHCSSPFGDGEMQFVENKTDPPSRAYLKLWEAFTLLQRHPGPGEKVLDVGSSPGGWTWVLDQLGASVLSVDKAPLSDQVKLSTRVQYLSESAFGLQPTNLGRFDWFFSDIICYPERLLELVHRWKDIVPNMVCTIKFQGETEHNVVKKFLEISGSKVMHLHHNKHELTWVRLAD